ncbi:MAG TPA: hypothetical protein VF597_02675 [Candidatus Saccharimonadales bacterium]|jgi:hypothetical protein
MPEGRAGRSGKQKAYAEYLQKHGVTRTIVAGRNAGPSQDQAVGSAALRRLNDPNARKKGKPTGIGRKRRFGI